MNRSDALMHEARSTLSRRTTRSYMVAAGVTAAAGFVGADSWFAALAVTPSLALSFMVLLTGWAQPAHRNLMLASGVVGAGTLVWTAFTHANLMGAVGITITGAMWVTYRRVRGQLQVIALCALVILVLLVAQLPDVGAELQSISVMSVVAIAWASAIVESDDQRRLFDLLERTKDAEREASILRERNRFAADLHDVQGHTLHVIKLKAAVAARLQHADPERTARELEDIGRLTAETIEQARDLANSMHKLVLSAELNNACELLTAAGIDTQVEYLDDELHVGSGENQGSLALVLREATTNILRHARPARVVIMVGPDMLVVRNDGITPSQLRPLRGLATLQQRMRDAGGTLLIESDDTTFCLRVVFEETAE